MQTWDYAELHIHTSESCPLIHENSNTFRPNLINYFYVWHVSGEFTFVPLWLPEWRCNKKKESKMQSNTSCHIIVEKEEVCVQPF